ncbi:MAG: ABC transporter ATP-binding protein [Xanthobacteraceae bacterium]|nr:MAG: ABC transporter ATP-binding protein [Xanthobacteraceae bacterium]
MDSSPSRTPKRENARRKFEPWLDPAAQPLIRFENVTKRFGTVTAVAGVSLDIYEREFFALLGPSGCGKTTLMRMLAGFEAPDEGRILLAGKDIGGVPPYRRPVNMMFQSYALFPHMTVADNIAFGLKQDGMPRDEIAQRVEEMLALVNLRNFGARRPDQLSGGQKQRVALARSLAKRPKVLLLDEPMAALDKKLREEMQFELMGLQQTLGMTFMIVTHDQEEAMTVADRIAVMDHGKLAQVATPSEIYEQPNSRYVADFVGDINLIEAKVAQITANGTSLHSPQIPAELRVSQRIDVRADDTVTVALRPEKIRVGKEPMADAHVNYAQGRVIDIAYLGDLSIYRVQLDSGLILKAAKPNLSRQIEPPIDWDETVSLSWTEDAATLLKE